MVAPRLLDKRTVNAEVATQKAQQVKEGIILAKKVDAIREELGAEEARMEEFRTKSLKNIQTEIDAKVAERDQLSRDNTKLREERIQLQAPLDLKEEWDRVNALRVENEVWQSKLIENQVSVLAQVADNTERTDQLNVREGRIEEKELLIARTLQEAEEKFATATETIEGVHKQEKLSKLAIRGKERDITIKENELQAWERDLRIRENALLEQSSDLTDRERTLQVRYQTFMRAQNYIKNK